MLLPAATPFSWIAVNAIPLLAFEVARAVLTPGDSAIRAAFAFGALVIAVSVGQGLALRARLQAPSRWASVTAFALMSSIAAAAVTLALADAAGSERLGIVAGHTFAGFVFGTIQASLLRAELQSPVRWALTTGAVWSVLALALVAASSIGWRPGGNISLFAGAMEFAALVSILAAYGLLTAPWATRSVGRAV